MRRPRTSLQETTVLHAHFNSLDITKVLNRISFEDQKICFAGGWAKIPSSLQHPRLKRERKTGCRTFAFKGAVFDLSALCSFPLDFLLNRLCVRCAGRSLLAHRLPSRPCVARRSTGIHFCTFVQFRCPSARSRISRDRSSCPPRSSRGASKGRLAAPVAKRRTPVRSARNSYRHPRRAAYSRNKRHSDYAGQAPRSPFSCARR